jgi:cellobiose phosphorylase
LIEHILVEHLVQFFNVGEHNITRLEDADWNDGLDMAKERGESVTFASFYGGNLLALADLLEDLSKAKGLDDIHLAVEIKTLLDSLTNTPVDYDDAQAKQKFLFEVYFPSVQPEVSGEKSKVPISKVIGDLREKGNWIFGQIRANEIITAQEGRQTNSWFNGYYDNSGTRVEGKIKGRARMTLVGQVFPIMSGLANEKEIRDVIKAVRYYLKDEKLGGYRLNTNFDIPLYMDLGRAFGFAYGTKENGAFFSHMVVMYAYALYKRGFVREGHDALRSIYSMCNDTRKSKIYPGIPEYFDSQGRGFYHYLTGSASWMVLTELTQVFGVRGSRGDLLLEPKLVCEEFDPKTAKAVTVCHFAGKKITVSFENPKKLDHGAYGIKEVLLNGKAAPLDRLNSNTVKIQRKIIESAPRASDLRVVLGPNSD